MTVVKYDEYLNLEKSTSPVARKEPNNVCISCEALLNYVYMHDIEIVVGEIKNNVRGIKWNKKMKLDVIDLIAEQQIRTKRQIERMVLPGQGQGGGKAKELA